jgi:hypothetical protein
VSRLGEGRSGKGGVGSWLLLGLSRYGWRLEGKGKLMCRGMGRRPTGFGQRERKTWLVTGPRTKKERGG